MNSNLGNNCTTYYKKTIEQKRLNKNLKAIPVNGIELQFCVVYFLFTNDWRSQ